MPPSRIRQFFFFLCSMKPNFWSRPWIFTNICQNMYKINRNRVLSLLINLWLSRYALALLESVDLSRSVKKETEGPRLNIILILGTGEAVLPSRRSMEIRNTGQWITDFLADKRVKVQTVDFQILLYYYIQNFSILTFRSLLFD